MPQLKLRGTSETASYAWALRLFTRGLQYDEDKLFTKLSLVVKQR